MKLNARGQKEWDKIIDAGVEAMEKTSDGGYILGGSKTGTGKNDNVDYWIVKIDASGNKLWEKTYGGTGDDLLSAVKPTADGGYILGGTSYSTKGGDKSDDGKGGRDYWIIKVDAAGIKRWDKALGSAGDEQFLNLQLTQDGGYILGGWSGFVQGGDKTEASRGEWDYWIVKLDALGNKVWDKTLGGKDADYLKVVQQTPDGGYLVGGDSQSNKSGDKTENRRGSDDYWVVKLDAQGNKQWDKTLGGNREDRLTSLLLTNDEGLLLAGSSGSDISGEKTDPRIGYSDYWLVKLSSTGEKLWDKTIGGKEGNFLTSAQVTGPGQYILAGYSDSNKSGDKTENSRGNYDYWVVKVKPGPTQAQTIAFDSIPDKIIGNPSFPIKASSSSGLPVSFKVFGPATIKGNQVIITGGGRVTIEATQPGNNIYKPAPVVTRSFYVNFEISQLWDRTLGGSHNDFLRAMVPTPDGGYLLGGTSESGKIWDKSQPSKGGTDYWIIKIDSSGSKLWDRSYGGSAIDDLKALVATPDGGYLLGGTSASGKSGDKSQATRGKEDYWVVKIDSTGNKLWDKTFGSDVADNFTSLIATPDGGYLLGGYTAGGKSGDKTELSLDAMDVYTDRLNSNDYWVVKIDNKGEKEWDKTVGGKYQDELTSLEVTDDGYLLAGRSNSYARNADPDNFDIRIDMRVFKISTTGQVLWDKSFSGGGLLQYYEANIIATTDGNYLVGGSAYNDDYSVFSVLKITKAGEKIWAYEYGVNQSGSAMINTPDGGYLLGGSQGNGEKYYFIVKLDADGHKIYTNSYNRTDKYSSPDSYLEALLPTPDGGYLLGGASDSNQSANKSEDSKGDFDYWVLKIKEADTPPVADIAWNQRYGGSWHDKLTTTIRTYDGGYVAAGYSRSPKNGDKTQSRIGLEDYWLVKTDQQGKKLWDKRFGGPRHDFLNRIIQTTDGGYLLGGSSDSNSGGDKSQNSLGGRDYWVIRLDKNGNKLWDKRYGGSGYDELRQIKQLPSGGYLLAGYSNSSVSGDKSQPSKGGMDYWVVQISANGEKQWDKTYGGSGNDFLQDVVLTSSYLPNSGHYLDGGFLLAGSSNSNKSGNKTQDSRGGLDFWIICVDSTGQNEWDRTYGGKGQDEFVALTTDSGIRFYLAGNSDSPVSGEKRQPGKGQTDYWLVRINRDGRKEADYTYGSSGPEELRSLLSVYDSDYDQDGFILSGTSYSGQSGDKSQESQGSGDYWVVRTNRYGKMLNDQRLGGSELDELRSVIQTDENQFLLAGRSESGISGDRTQANQGQSDYWLIHTTLGAEPLATEKAATLIAERATTTAAPATLVKNLMAYPNPFQDRVTINFTIPETQPATVRVLDGQGREVITLFQQEAQANQTYQVEWQAQNQVDGLYLLQLQTPTQQNTQKLLLSK
ncbi:T9SS type A sorting domain-containing protein [Adhaeribacter pallidiroseus]|uniref:DNA helicase n=1 Tax=Adhaeribacter pallidiroseus TaxID=2072847 RepID=A0A369Q921_9BACT|nr:T9SS type A sorting domain-containing protein [Adhaeribacter pallidiroseus]RDC58788.1 DNA helicase [Adhaeribacter pallidiroseus]